MTPEEWFTRIPFVAKRYFVIILATTLASTVGLFHVGHFALHWSAIRYEFQIWRLFTAYFFFGNLSLNFFFSMGLLLQYFRGLEGEYFSANGRQRMDFLFTLFLGWIILTPLFLFVFPLYFPGPVLVTYLGYLWSRKDPFRPIDFYGFTLKLWHTPLLAIFIDVVMQNPMLPTFIAIFVGHFVHMLRNMVPQRYGVNPISCPEFLLDIGDKYLSDHAIPNNIDNSGQNQPTAAAQQPTRPVWARGAGNRL